jgi:pSer/pThr/pTyr-binding forkhead associated (FHA) protein
MYCPECGFHQTGVPKFCERCGALLIAEGQTGETTGPFIVDREQIEEALLTGAVIEGPALAVRSGGGLEGEVFPLDRDRVTIGRGPESDIFLNDVTVSRNHAVIERGADGPHLRDLGSLNGTYVNRRRIEAEEPLEDGDELQVGKFRLAYISG